MESNSEVCMKALLQLGIIPCETVTLHIERQRTGVRIIKNARIDFMGRTYVAPVNEGGNWLEAITELARRAANESHFPAPEPPQPTLEERRVVALEKLAEAALLRAQDDHANHWSAGIKQ